MVGHESGAILRQMQALLNVGTFSGLSDQQLLEQFLERRDEVAELAFAVLVERHGPMVLGVCLRIMHDRHDAEDAFQATFLVLARKGRSIRVEGSIGRWLFGVATRVATRARSDELRRRNRERSGIDRLDGVGSDTSPADLDRAEVQATIAREIAGLPARFQAPVLLCDLEGTSYEEASRRLGWPVGTVKSRLSRARARLRDRLTRRGLAPADLSIVTALLPSAPPPSLVASTTRAALALISGRLTSACGVSASVTTLTQGVLRTMTITRFKFIAAALLLVATGSAALFGQAAPQKVPGGGGGRASTVASARIDSAPASDDRIDLELLERAWVDAINRRDTGVIGRILADDFESIDPLGSTLNKMSYLAHLKGGALASGVALEQIKVRLFDDAGVVISQLKPGPSQRYERATKVYIKRQGRWNCVASHVEWSHGADVTFSEDAKAEWKKAVDEWRTSTLPTKNNCVACHGVDVHREIQPNPASVLPPGSGNGQPDKELHLEIVGDGRITIEGKPVDAVKTAVEERLKASKDRIGRTDLIITASPDTQYHVVAMVTGAAQSVGIHRISLVTRANPPDSQGPSDPSRPRGRATKPADRPALIRSSFNCRVVGIAVKAGEPVKKGDPLLQVISADLAAAKGDYELAVSQWNRDKKMYDYKRPMGNNYMMPRKEQIEVENDEAQSRLRMKLARDRLLILGLTEEEIAMIGKEEDRERTRHTIRSRVDGVVLAVDAVPGNDYDPKDVLIKIGPSPAPGH